MLHIFQPEPENELTGGFLYNQRMCAELAGARVHEAPAETLEEALAAFAGPTSHLLVDSLYIGGPGVADALARHRGAALVHHLPSCDPGFPADLREAQQRHERAFLRAADLVIVTSEFMRSLLREREGLSAAHACPPGVDDDFFRITPQAAPGPPQIVTIANLEPRKGLLEHVAPLGRIAKELEFTWHLIGAPSEPSYAERVRVAVKRAGLEPRTTFHGRLGRAALCERLARASLHLFPTRFESYGMAVAESLAAGVPVAAPALGEIESLVRDGETGLLARPEDPEALISQLARFLSDGALRARLRSECSSGRQSLPRWREAARALGDALDGRTRVGC